ncbi:SDR family NAD(P)-dependent oxidoreductase [Brucella tritici]|jgi:NAD(P)-dependent dehydrogenase (short-subunit alcohol dehydrogenase family)|uniref:SDR family NAD(P)-dependent oxidoreductase n=3 Tax=Brucella/Ochrobactrum group TaxID=2826938 RepID=A0ABD5K0I4_9HYPH|nr:MULTISPECIES: SDR family NAD(P)-dependent oxidoreductase [Brucella/Ochrobactrum group]MCR5944075.1 SDR family NAD(P)-dependent oxidoreductase [Ochrobactrum sp. XJ1]EXL03150.1 oxidoreductase [Brucella anthropi]KAB2673494.1 SDR family NAD(P)-dependent oxidoreductase [Brucella tritici]KAB2706070.1 SDR family NAD(P)-dependent oxidoreductase [Brucella intermedia]KIU66514.1 oxidoreductase [Brucella anthropi]
MQHGQTPLGTPFGPCTTAQEVIRDIDLTGKTAVVTGGASNLGLETVRILAWRGARVIVPVRDIGTAGKMLCNIPNVELFTMDLLDPASVRSFADKFVIEHGSLDILILSAGVMATPLFRDAEGHEGQFATNHLGHFRLTAALWPALCAAKNARVIVLSSRGHQLGGLALEDLDFVQRPYDKWLAYGQAKTANALFAVAVDARGINHGVRAFSVHPGSILGPLARHLSREEIDSFGAIDNNGQPVIDPDRDMKTPQQGAATTIWCATAPELAGIGGVYCENCDIARVERQERFGVRPFAIDPDIAEALWAESVRLTGYFY